LLLLLWQLRCDDEHDDYDDAAVDARDVRALRIGKTQLADR